MTTAQFFRIQEYRSASQLHNSPPRHSSSPYQHRTRKFSLSSLTSPSPTCAVSTLENTDALLSSPSPTDGAVSSQESEDIEIIANGNPVSPATTFPISYCSAMMSTEGEDVPDFSRRRVSRTQSFDKTVFDIRKVPPEQIAAQITLLDLKVFKGISPKELRGTNWNKKEKRELAPNIVAFTQQFNHMAFLVVREILNEVHEKVRAEIISQFIKIAKKLHDLNNLHSLRAVISALQSMPIYRLSLTWRHVPKRDKSTFEKLEELLSSDNNWKLLRDEMDALRLPCIPDLSLYLTDLCFLQSLPNNSSKVESIINVICYFQNSTYDGYEPEAHVQKYLTTARYIEELQKFHEDDNYKLSLQLEPQIPKPPDTSAIPSASRSPMPPRNASRPQPSSMENKLRGSRSCEEGLNTDECIEVELDDTESPYAISPRNSYTRRSLNTNSRGGINVAVASKQKLGMARGQQYLYRSKRSTPFNLGLGHPRGDNVAGYVADSKKLAACANSQSSSPFSRSKLGDLMSEDNTMKDVKLVSGPLATFGSDSVPMGNFSCTSTNVGGGETHSLPPQLVPQHSSSETSSLSPCASTSTHSTALPPPAQKHTQAPQPSPLLAARKRGHKKSQSHGTNIFAKFNVTKMSPPEHPKRYSPEPATIMMNLIDDSVLSDAYPMTPTDSIGNGSSGASSMEDVMSDLLRMSVEEDPEDNLIKKGILRKKDVRHRGVTVSQFKHKSKGVFELYPNKIVFTELKGKKLGKQVTTVLLRSCRLKHRDPRENLSEKQFLIIDDDGNSTKFTGSSPKDCMQWVVAIKEAIRVIEEKDREEAEKSLIKL